MTPSTKLGLISMPLFFAESTTESVNASALGEWLIIAAAVLVIVKIGWDMLDRVRGPVPQKREVSFATEVVSKTEGDAMREAIEKIDRERRTSVAELHKRIENVVERLNDRIDKVPERTIELLRTTKNLI